MLRMIVVFVMVCFCSFAGDQTVLRNTQTALTSAAFSVDGKVLLTGNQQGEIEVWNTSDWTSMNRFKALDNAIEHVAVLDETTAVAMKRGGVAVLDLKTGGAKASYSLPSSGLPSWSMDSRLLIYFEDAKLKMKDSATGTELAAWKIVIHPEDCVPSLALSADGSVVVVETGTQNRNFHVFNAKTGKEINAIDYQGFEQWIQLSPDGKFLVARKPNGNLLNIWDVKTGKLFNEVVPEKANGASATAFSADGQFFAMAISREQNGKFMFPILVLNASNWTAAGEIPGQVTHATRIAFSPDGKKLVSFHDKSFAIWDLTTFGPGANRANQKVTPPVSKMKLWQAASDGETAIVERLLNEGVDPNDTDPNGNSALSYAINRGHIEIAKLLIEHNADAKFTNKTSGSTLLHKAAESGYLDIAKALLKRGADVNSAEKRGYTPLMLANDAPMVQLLLENKANINSKDNTGNTVLHRHMRFGTVESLKLLLKAGADANTKNDEGKKPSEILENGPETQAKIQLLKSFEKVKR